MDRIGGMNNMSEREAPNPKPECPECGSDNIAGILWGMPAFDEELERDIEEGRIVLGGCCISEADPDWHCNDCGCEFGNNPAAYERWRTERDNKRKGVIFGAAVGDALGVPFEFKGRDSFDCTEMIGHGTYDVPKGTFSDDTSMLLATLDSIRECGGIDIDDMRSRFRAWLYKGEYTPDGKVFDVGSATSRALEQGHGCDGERDNGNGSLMRIAPLAFTTATDEQIEAVSAITHAHEISRQACVMFVHMLRGALDDGAYGLGQAVEDHVPDDDRFHFMMDIVTWPREDVRSTGYVLDTLGAALWCVWNTDNYRDCVLTAVNLGDDTDTTACVAGAFAGAIYGFDDIPEDWIESLRGKDVIDRCLGETEEEAATLTREERHALERWTGGIASVNRVLRGESPYPKKDRIALKSSWDIKHMPRHKHTTIGIGIELSEEELIELAKGHIPDEMEDHWFMYFDGEYIRYYRSWTGICIYKGHVTRRDGSPVIGSLIVNRDPEQYGEVSDEKDRLMFEMLVTEELGKDSSRIWDAIFSLDN